MNKSTKNLIKEYQKGIEIREKDIKYQKININKLKQEIKELKEKLVKCEIDLAAVKERNTELIHEGYDCDNDYSYDIENNTNGILQFDCF